MVLALFVGLLIRQSLGFSIRFWLRLCLGGTFNFLVFGRISTVGMPAVSGFSCWLADEKSVFFPLGLVSWKQKFCFLSCALSSE